MRADMWMLFDDARPVPERACLRFAEPSDVIIAREHDEVRRALDRLREALRAGHHVAGYMAYEAGFALDPALAGMHRSDGQPLLLFGLFDAPERLSQRERADLLAGAGRASLNPFTPRISKQDYEAAATTVREALFAGDYYQANLTFGCNLLAGGEPLALYAKLAASGGGGWGGVLVHDDGALVSLSPELFFTLKDGTLSARPMKGTAPRRADPEADEAERVALMSDEKQRAENLMIVDLLRNDLARVAETGSVTVPDLFTVEIYPTVHQMVSRIEARIGEGLDAVDALEKLFPCGSVTGAPKIAAMRALVDLEPEPRGAYTGSMGWIAPGVNGAAGDAAFNVLIRTIQIDAARAQARIGLGSGLVVDSKPAQEWAECLLKGAFVNRVTQKYDLIETMRYDPVEGIHALEDHLLRMKVSAGELGFAYDRHDARNELQAATFGQKEASMVRLLTGPGGAMAIEVKPMPPAPSEPVDVLVKPLPVDPRDFRLRHKTSDRDFYDDAREPDRAFETIFEREDGLLTEGSFTSIFAEKHGQLTTPPLSLGLIPGILRGQLLSEGRAVEGVLTRSDLEDGFWIGNSARGLIAARLAD
ncbi:aminodeoxychorismate synthase component I [Sphingomicrobium sediminis]|uniref:Probable branched-chain-amino-acid aminotransferase n=1 Tax=Sphingomicrobium sediminis TaxID=2950949 RepID=A0A9X2EI00_9SPHN|nr:aminodeoxychorismate synthase component I [Sphingomicrobium sediminis]MCM8558408.1 aminodeoxychorismate synthase component I [Sphingomicrobium sediminis]